MLIALPAKSTLGTGTPFAPPASVTTNQSCAGTEPAVFRLATLLDAAVLAAERYCRDMPDSGIAELVGLYRSTKSFVYVAPLLPPPPYTSLMTSPVPPGFASAAVATRNWKPVIARASETRVARRARPCDRGAGMKALRRWSETTSSRRGRSGDRVGEGERWRSRGR